MEFKVNDLSLTEREVEVKFGYDEIKKDVDEEVKKRTKNIQIAGFRKGKVPLTVLKKMYGDALEYEASEKVASNRFWEIAKDNHLHPIGQPSMTDIQFKPGEDFSFKVKYEVVPELDVKGYTGQEIEIPDYEVKDKDVESEIEYILKANSTRESAEQTGDDNNYVLDVEKTRVDEQGNRFSDSKPEKIQIDLTNERVQPEIVQNAKNKKLGDTFGFSFTDERLEKDKDGNENKVEEKYIYNALIKSIEKIVTPELNEELIKKVTKDKVSTETELREEIKKDIQNYYDQRTEELTQDKLLSAVVKNNEFNPPSALVANILEDLIKREEENYKKQGYKKFDKNEAAEKLKGLAELEVKWFLIKDAIRKKENIAVSDEELSELAAKDAEKTGIAVDKLVNYYKSSNYSEKLLDKKLFDFLKEKNIIKKVEPEKLSQNQTKE